MIVDFQITYTAKCNIDDAFVDYNAYMEWHPDCDPNEAINDAIEENLVCPKDVDVPQEIIDQFINALKKRIGGIQLKMELD